MIKNQNFIVFSDDWGRHPSSCQHIFKRITKANKVLWVNTIGLRKPSIDRYTILRGMEKAIDWVSGMKRINKNLWVYSPFMMPAMDLPSYESLFNMRFLARTLRAKLKKLDMDNPILWATVPNAADLLGMLEEKVKVYYCTDDYSMWPGGNRDLILEQENRLMESADMIFAASSALVKKGLERNKNTFYLSHGVDVEHFQRAFADDTVVHSEIANIPRPIIGYFGLIWEKVDMMLIRKVALSNPDCSLVLIGRVASKIDELKHVKNAYLLGPKRYELLPNYAKAFDICILPYLKDYQIQQSAPLKLKEYLAIGKPIVSIDIPEVSHYSDHIYIAKDDEEFIKNVKLALSEAKLSQQKDKKRQDAVKEESWEKKVDFISQKLEELCCQQEAGYKIMPKGIINKENFIVFSDDWGRHPSSCQHIFKRIAKANKVLWVNTIGLRKPRPNLIDLVRSLEKIKAWIWKRVQRDYDVIIYSPIMNPFYGVKFLREINQKNLVSAIKRQLLINKMEQPILVTTVPNISDLVGCLGEKNSVYYCVDDFSKWPGMEKEMIEEMERELLKKVELVLVTSDKLYEEKKGSHCATYKLYHGVDVEHFRKCSEAGTKVPSAVSKIKRPIIGYFGLFDERLDFDILMHIGQVHPEWSIVILGKVVVNTRQFRRRGNFHFLGNIPYERLPNYVKPFDVCILPYLINELTMSINPLKLREYLATGKPVVSTDLPEVRPYKDEIGIANNKHEFLRKIELSLKEANQGDVERRQRLVQGESWEKKAEEMSEYLKEILE